MRKYPFEIGFVCWMAFMSGVSGVTISAFLIQNKEIPLYIVFTPLSLIGLPFLVYWYVRLQLFVLPLFANYCQKTLLLPAKNRNYREAIHLLMKIIKFYHKEPEKCERCLEINSIIYGQSSIQCKSCGKYTEIGGGYEY